MLGDPGVERLVVGLHRKGSGGYDLDTKDNPEGKGARDGLDPSAGEPPVVVPRSATQSIAVGIYCRGRHQDQVDVTTSGFISDAGSRNTKLTDDKFISARSTGKPKPVERHDPVFTINDSRDGHALATLSSDGK